MTPALPLQLTLMGGFVLRRGDQEIKVAVGGQRLITLLALRNRRMGRLTVARTLWPDYPGGRSAAILRTALWRVNQAGGQPIRATPSALSLEVGVEVDVHHLVAFARRLTPTGAASRDADLSSLSVADLACDLLPGWYDDWVQDEREGLLRTRLYALENLARKLSASGRHADAIQAALAAIRLEPLRESAHQTLIELHLAEGNRSEAWRQFQRCRRLLWEELGVDPPESMRLLLEHADLSRPAVLAAAARGTRTP
jgi:DNA-binding SARP family transcriptional activator